MTFAAALPPAKSLVGTLPAGALDIVGDVHGEWQALQALLRHLGYDAQGRHPEGRILVFVGDLCDRGPDTPAVLDWFCEVYARSDCLAILGNHEINLIREDAKDGAGWFFDSRTERDRAKYAPFAIASPAQRQRYLAVCAALPVALERADLRIVHAAWMQPQIEAARTMPRGSARQHYDRFEQQAEHAARAGSLQQRLQREKALWPHDVEDSQLRPPLLRAHGERELLKQMTNPLKVLTTGVEAAAPVPFYAGGKWRFVERQPWWDRYEAPTPVVIGHYWRMWRDPQRPAALAPATEAASAPPDGDLFACVPSNAWHGLRHNVFCVDYSVGARWSERLQGRTDPSQSRFRLAALRWPERTLVFDDGQQCETIHFGRGVAPLLS
ncbi:metallophosphoesterase [Lampropedia cohaerens]|uniref:Metallophosphoesterase n=1 Tax=Lampropedia cohaerens TaxID=1610491 RepID=A0A0U1PX85_9BURK|nr:metallophosphoesterase [Lampropedia cohaerens]KKW67148.1 metallophosphoesterase [Lampropedia cohaerens]